MTMAASVILEHLPRDAHAALETAGELRDANGELKGKVKTNFAHLQDFDCTSTYFHHSQSTSVTLAEYQISQATCLQLWDLAAL